MSIVVCTADLKTSSVSGIRGGSRRLALSGRMRPVSWEEVGPLVTAVVRCDPVVRGPNVAPMWPPRSPWRSRFSASLVASSSKEDSGREAEEAEHAEQNQGDVGPALAFAS